MGFEGLGMRVANPQSTIDPQSRSTLHSTAAASTAEAQDNIAHTWGVFFLADSFVW